mgnify:CR=1 FL=1
MEPVRYFLGRYRAGFAVPSVALPPGSAVPLRPCRPPPFLEARIEHYAQALVMRVSFFWGSAGGGAASHISVIVVKFLTVPLNRQIKVLYHGIESISR